MSEPIDETMIDAYNMEAAERVVSTILAITESGLMYLNDEKERNKAILSKAVDIIEEITDRIGTYYGIK